MKYNIDDVVYVSVIGKVSRIEKNNISGDVVYFIDTDDIGEIIAVKEGHLAIAPNPKDFENTSEIKG